MVINRSRRFKSFRAGINKTNKRILKDLTPRNGLLEDEPLGVLRCIVYGFTGDYLGEDPVCVALIIHGGLVLSFDRCVGGKIGSL
ncbi:hypothetical protein CW714_07480 [Methanophagales archaeon]|nr:MAG: hypothetical protein CW714_07480 [Methanophagales archaeon]